MAKGLHNFKTNDDEVADPAGYIESLAQAVIVLADKYGLVVTIEQKPLQPLAMGNYEAFVSVRDKRK